MSASLHLTPYLSGGCLVSFHRASSRRRGCRRHVSVFFCGPTEQGLECRLLPCKPSGSERDIPTLGVLSYFRVFLPTVSLGWSFGPVSKAGLDVTGPPRPHVSHGSSY